MAIGEFTLDPDPSIQARFPLAVFVVMKADVGVTCQFRRLLEPAMRSLQGDHHQLPSGDQSLGSGRKYANDLLAGRAGVSGRGLIEEICWYISLGV